MRFKKSVAVDFDGVIHGYSEGWKDGEVYDEPVEGSIEALEELSTMFNIYIFTVRKNKEVVKNYIQKYSPNLKFKVTNKKPHAEMYIDDRAINFSGDWKDTMNQVKNFQTWLKK